MLPVATLNYTNIWISGLLLQAHRGTGNYAYVTVVREVAAATSHFRVLALSATPGSDIKVCFLELGTRMALGEIVL